MRTSRRRKNTSRRPMRSSRKRRRTSRRRVEANAIPSPPDEWNRFGQWMTKTYAVGTPVKIRSDLRHVDGLKGVVTEARPSTTQSKITVEPYPTPHTHAVPMEVEVFVNRPLGAEYGGEWHDHVSRVVYVGPPDDLPHVLEPLEDNWGSLVQRPKTRYKGPWAAARKYQKPNRRRGRRTSRRKTIPVQHPFAPSYRLVPLVEPSTERFVGWEAVLVDPQEKVGTDMAVRAEDWREAVRQLEDKAGTKLQPWTYADRDPDKYKALERNTKRSQRRTSRANSRLTQNKIPSAPDNWTDYIWWAQRTFAPGTAVKLKHDWVGWDNGNYIDVPAGYKGEVTDIVVDDLATPPEWFEVIVQIGRGMAFPGARIQQQFSPGVVSRMGVRDWIEPLDDNWANGTSGQHLSRYQLPPGQKHGLLKPNRKTSRRPIRETRGARRTSRRGLTPNQQVPSRVRLRRQARGTAEIGNGMRYTKTVDVPAGTSGEIVQSHMGYWVVVMDPDATVPYPTMVVIDTHKTDPFEVLEPYGLEANPKGYNLSVNARRQRMPSKDIRPIVKRAKKQGWNVDVTRGGHVRFVPPQSGGSVVIASGSASDSRSIKNLRAQLRRAGLDI